MFLWTDCWLFFQDELDNQNPVLRDNHQLHEEVKCWLKEQKVQEIFLQGNCFVDVFVRVLVSSLLSFNLNNLTLTCIF